LSPQTAWAALFADEIPKTCANIAALVASLPDAASTDPVQDEALATAGAANAAAAARLAAVVEDGEARLAAVRAALAALVDRHYGVAATADPPAKRAG
jgi:hypothetical protein